jgi:hypothetical protein
MIFGPDVNGVTQEYTPAFSLDNPFLEAFVGKAQNSGKGNLELSANGLNILLQ